MKNQPILYAIIGLLLGVLLTTYTASNAVNNNMTGMMQMMGMRTNEGNNQHGMGMESSMDEMMESIETQEGDEFDKAFISAMIVHHQGAIEMANEAKIKARHEEIKNLAEDIISAQTKEINLMQEWQNNWG